MSTSTEIYEATKLFCGEKYPRLNVIHHHDVVYTTLKGCVFRMELKLLQISTTYLDLTAYYTSTKGFGGKAIRFRFSARTQDYVQCIERALKEFELYMNFNEDWSIFNTKQRLSLANYNVLKLIEENQDNLFIDIISKSDTHITYRFFNSEFTIKIDYHSRSTLTFNGEFTQKLYGSGDDLLEYLFPNKLIRQYKLSKIINDTI
jgi:hypothetical protein